ncbi:NAD(P)H-dependent flavin oxidoreductase [Burkholderia ubonensis]|uniref:NAD(P)H-dependent flavin oxidoreductase n=1 Tax=Burkholderia ubonensis TaxID=101571 RepID=UPI0009B3EDE3|nr:nitronate monooxygenase family protein [Burkholderia ubonensis]
MTPLALQGLRLPVIASPMLIASYPEMVLAQCKSGIVGAFPALNARPSAQLGDWIDTIDDALRAHRDAHPDAPVGPYAVNHICHPSNPRVEQDLRICIERRVPLMITSLRAPSRDVVDAIHAYGGLVLHDVTTVRHAQKALEAGVDGLVLVAAGAGGHAGTLSPFALVGEVRRFYDGFIALSGAIATGDTIAAARALGADCAYIGTRFLASHEANVVQRYKDTIVEATASDIVYTDAFTGVHGNYLRQSIEAAGLDVRHLTRVDGAQLDFSPDAGTKQWRDIWGAGQGVGAMDAVLSVAEIVARLEAEYARAVARLHPAPAAPAAAARRAPALSSSPPVETP